MALDPTKIAAIAYQVFQHGPDIGLSLQGGVGSFPFQEGSHIVSSGDGGNQWNLAGGSYSGATVTAGVTLTIDNYIKTTGGGLATVVNVIGLAVNAGTGVYATGHNEITGRLVTGTQVNAGGTLVIADGYSRLVTYQGREYWNGISLNREPSRTVISTTQNSAVTTTIHSGGRMVVGGYASGTVVEGGGYQLVRPMGSALATVVSGVGALQDVFGTTSGTVLSAGGIERVFQGTAHATQVRSGGILAFTGTGIASGTVISHGGVVSAGTRAVPVGTTGNLGDRATVFNTVISSGGQLTISGRDFGSFQETAYDSDTTILSGGQATVLEAAVAANTVIRAGGVLLLSSLLPSIGRAQWEGFSAQGGRAQGTTVSSGGILSATANSVVTGGIVHSGGKVIADGFRPAYTVVVRNPGYTGPYVVQDLEWSNPLINMTFERGAISAVRGFTQSNTDVTSVVLEALEGGKIVGARVAGGRIVASAGGTLVSTSVGHGRATPVL